MENLLVASLGFGLVTASIVALGAVGFTLQVGITNVLNMAYGSLLTMGAFLTYSIQRASGMTVWLALLVGSLALGVISVFINRLLIMPFIRRGSSSFSIILVTFAIGITLQYIVVAIYGVNFYSITNISQHSLHWGALTFTYPQLTIIGIVVLAMLSVHGILRYTKFGKAMRAMADNRNLARSSGINVNFVADTTWFISGILAGGSGVALAIASGSFIDTTGNDFLLVIVAATVLGGSGRVYGAMLASLILGLSMEISTVWIPPEYKEVVALVLLVIVVLIRPQGILPGRGRAVLTI